MALKTNVPGRGPSIYDDSFVADGSLASYENCVVEWSAQSSGQPKVKAPTGQGVISAGVCLNAPATGALAEVRMKGIVKVKANAALNAGIQVTVADTAGTVGAASSGDYVLGVSLEAAAEANQLIKVAIDTFNETVI